MSNILDALMSQMGGNALGTLSQQIGADPSTTQSAVSVALPMLLSALAKNTAQDAGATALHQALGNHDGSILDDLAGAFTNQNVAADGTNILGHVLGGKEDAMGAALGRMTGLSGGQAAQLLSMLAPVVLGMLGRQQRSNGWDVGALAGMLGQANTQARANMPQQHSLLTSLLDQDGDGSIQDDIGRAGMNILGGFFKK